MLAVQEWPVSQEFDFLATDRIEEAAAHIYRKIP